MIFQNKKLSVVFCFENSQQFTEGYCHKQLKLELIQKPNSKFSVDRYKKLFHPFRYLTSGAIKFFYFFILYLF